MVELIASSPCEGILPISIGDIVIDEYVVPAGTIWEHPKGDISIGFQRSVYIGAPREGAIDQSDAWVILVLSGSSYLDVLARLCPVDLRQVSQPITGQLRQISVLFQHEAQQMRIWVPRSMVRTAIRELSEAAERVAGRSSLLR
ncbi:MAG: hypothetical protein ABJ327_21185 [Litoreibacter sp.]